MQTQNGSAAARFGMVQRGDRLIYVRHLEKGGGAVAFIPTS